MIVALGIRAFLNSSQLQQFSLFGSTCSKLIILIIVRIVKLFRVSGIKRLDYMNWLANVSMTADQILVIEKGRIAEQGTHDVLLQKNGIYSSFICSRKEAVSWKVQKHS